RNVSSRSPSRKRLARVKSKFVLPGPRSMFRDELPQLNAVGVVNAAGLNHCKIVRFSGYKGCPGTISARPPLPVLVGEPGAVTVNGRPVWNTMIPEKSQPRRTTAP